jgi:metallo-beta-lactamase family protein
MTIKFLGATREVTGSKHLITTAKGRTILLDCGLYQGKGLETYSMNCELGFDPEKIDYILLSHAHIDHSGLIPYIYKKGFRGTVLCTHATRDLCSILLPDSGHIQEHDTIWFNKKRKKQNLPPVEPLYKKDDALICMETFTSTSYDRKFRIDEEISVTFTNSGHLLGGSVINIEIKENGKTIKIAYTGDIGRPVNRILKSPQPFPQADIIICESTYGNRLHDEIPVAEENLLKVIKETCINKKGKVIIPSFSVGRTQEIVYSLNNFFNEKKLPPVNIYVDSPLSVNATNIFRLHPECFNKNVLDIMHSDPDPFGFNSLYYISSVEESKKLNELENPCVIISSSGMMEAGRIKHHLANNIENPKNTILVVGYCAQNTLGAKIVRGDKKVSIFGMQHNVNADVRIIESFSGHADYNELINFLHCQDPAQVSNLFLVHGDYESQLFFKTKLEENNFNNIEIPVKGAEYKF